MEHRWQRHLRDLEPADADARAAALDDLRAAVLPHGFPDAVTAPAVRAITALLAGDRAHPDTVDGLLDLLGDAAASVTLADGTSAGGTSVGGAPVGGTPVGGTPVGGTLMGGTWMGGTWMGGVSAGSDRRLAALLPDLADSLAAALPVMLPHLADAPPERALHRADALVLIAGLPSAGDRRAALAAVVQEWSQRGIGARAEWARLLGRLGTGTRHLLTDPDPEVRLGAALDNVDDPGSRDLVLAGLARPDFPTVHRFEIVDAAIRTAGDFAAIAGPACEFVRGDGWVGAEKGWGALLRFAFAQPYAESRALTPPQRALLRALVANDQLWDPSNAACGNAFRAAGLPHDRSAVRAISAAPDRRP